MTQDAGCQCVVSGLATRPEEFTADLGLIYDETYRGPGLKIAEILKRGPADKRGLSLKPGEIIVALDGVELTEKVNVGRLLNDSRDHASFCPRASSMRGAPLRRTR